MFAIRNEQTNQKHEWIFLLFIYRLNVYERAYECTIVYVGHLLKKFKHRN